MGTSINSNTPRNDVQANTADLNDAKTSDGSTTTPAAQVKPDAAQFARDINIKDGAVISDPRQAANGISNDNFSGAEIPTNSAGSELDQDGHNPINTDNGVKTSPKNDGRPDVLGGAFSPEDKFDQERGSQISDRAAGGTETAGTVVDVVVGLNSKLGPIGVGVAGGKFANDPSLVNGLDFFAAAASISGNPLLATFGTAYGVTRVADETTNGVEGMVNWVTENEEPGEFGNAQPGTSADPISSDNSNENRFATKVDNLNVDHGAPATSPPAGGDGDDDGTATDGAGDGDGGSTQGTGQTQESGQTTGAGGDADDEDGDDGSGDGDGTTTQATNDSSTEATETENTEQGTEATDEAEATGEGGGGDAEGDSTPHPDDASGDNPNPGWTPDINLGGPSVNPKDTVSTPADPNQAEYDPALLKARIDELSTGLSDRTQWAINTGDTTDGVGGTQPGDVDPAVLPDEDPVGDPGSPNGNPNDPA